MEYLEELDPGVGERGDIDGIPAGRLGGTGAVGGEGESAADGEEADAGSVDFALCERWKRWKRGCGRAPWRAGSR